MSVIYRSKVGMGLLFPLGSYKTISDNDIHSIQLDKESKGRFHNKIYYGIKSFNLFGMA